ncbi:MAG: cation:proton antiporter [Bacteroidota bacterium]
MEPYDLILGGSIVLIASYFANILAKKTNIPAVLMLMVIGYVIQQFVGIDQKDLLGALNILGPIGVILIVLEASLDLKLEKEKTGLILKATGLAIILLFVTSAAIALALTTFLDMSFYTGLLYAVPLSVLSSAVIIPSVGGLIDIKKELLIYESAISDIVGIILFYALLPFGEEGAGGGEIIHTLSDLGLTVLLSVVFSYLLIILFQYVTEGAKLFLLMATLVGLYAAGKQLHLSPLPLIMVFGLALNNQKVFFRGGLKHLVDESKLKHILHDLHFITLETAFLVRTFFFVAFGMSIVLGDLIHWSVPLITLFAIVAIYGSRFVGLRVAMGKDITPEIFVAPRGLITVLLFYSIPAELASEEFQPGILLLTILVTSLVMTFGLIREARVGTGMADDEGEEKSEGSQGENPTAEGESQGSASTVETASPAESKEPKVMIPFPKPQEPTSSES